MTDDELAREFNSSPIPLFQFGFSTIQLFRCTKREYAEQFCQGKLYFGSPADWVEMEKQGNRGQGDILEGVFFSCPEDESSQLVRCMKTDISLECFSHAGLLFFRRRRVLNLRCLCLYGLHDNTFKRVAEPTGKAYYQTTITRRYFASFSDCKSRDEYNAINRQEQPVVVLVHNPGLFFERVRTFLYCLDVNAEEIIISPVEYLDRGVRSFAQVQSPRELLIKDMAFQDQSEVRIIINSNSKKYLQYMKDHNNIIDIGSLEDITTIYDYYFDDMSIERWSGIGLMISRPEKREFNIRDMDFFELEDFLVSILRGTVKLTRVPENSKTWQEKLSLIIDLFKEKFGVIVVVDEDRHIYMYNLSQELLTESRIRYADEYASAEFEERINQICKQVNAQDALRECEKEYENKVLSGVAYYCAGEIKLKMEKYNEAVEAFNKAYERKYKTVDSLNGLAVSLFRLNLYREAIDAYTLIQDEVGYHQSIYDQIGKCYINLGEYEKAIEQFDKSISLNADNAVPYFNKGIAYYLLGNADMAKTCMQKAIELDPQNETYVEKYNSVFQQ